MTREQEARITAFIGIYGCAIMANTAYSDWAAGFWIATSIFWLIRYFHLTNK